MGELAGSRRREGWQLFRSLGLIMGNTKFDYPPGPRLWALPYVLFRKNPNLQTSVIARFFNLTKKKMSPHHMLKNPLEYTTRTDELIVHSSGRFWKICAGPNVYASDASSLMYNMKSPFDKNFQERSRRNVPAGCCAPRWQIVYGDCLYPTIGHMVR